MADRNLENWVTDQLYALAGAQPFLEFCEPMQESLSASRMRDRCCLATSHGA